MRPGLSASIFRVPMLQPLQTSSPDRPFASFSVTGPIDRLEHGIYPFAKTKTRPLKDGLRPRYHLGSPRPVERGALYRVRLNPAQPVNLLTTTSEVRLRFVGWLVLWFAAKRLIPLPSLTGASGRAYWPPDRAT